MSQPLYSQMLEKAGHWPVNHRSDLAVHDRKALREAPVGTHFLWIVRESGTDFYRLDQPLDRLAAAYWIHQRALPMRLFMGRVTGRSAGVATGVLVRISPDDASLLLKIAAMRFGMPKRSAAA